MTDSCLDCPLVAGCWRSTLQSLHLSSLPSSFLPLLLLVHDIQDLLEEKDKTQRMFDATLYICRYLWCKLFEVAAVCSFIGRRPSSSWSHFLVVLSSQLNIPQGQLLVNMDLQLLVRIWQTVGWRQKGGKPQHGLGTRRDCIDAKLVKH